MFKRNRIEKNKEMNIMEMLKELLDSAKKEAVVNGLQSDFELSIKNVQGKKKGMSSPEIMIKGNSAGMLVGMAILYKELKKKIPMYDGILDDTIDALDSITDRYERVEKEIK